MTYLALLNAVKVGAVLSLEQILDDRRQNRQSTAWRCPKQPCHGNSVSFNQRLRLELLQAAYATLCISRRRPLF